MLWGPGNDDIKPPSMVPKVDPSRLVTGPDLHRLLAVGKDLKCTLRIGGDILHIKVVEGKWKEAAGRSLCDGYHLVELPDE